MFFLLPRGTALTMATEQEAARVRRNERQGRLLDALSVGSYLNRRGLLVDDSPDDTVVVTSLGGGVSSVVLLVELARQRLVVEATSGPASRVG